MVTRFRIVSMDIRISILVLSGSKMQENELFFVLRAFLWGWRRGSAVPEWNGLLSLEISMKTKDKNWQSLTGETHDITKHLNLKFRLSERRVCALINELYVFLNRSSLNSWYWCKTKWHLFMDGGSNLQPFSCSRSASFPESTLLSWIIFTYSLGNEFHLRKQKNFFIKNFNIWLNTYFDGSALWNEN